MIDSLFCHLFYHLFVSFAVFSVLNSCVYTCMYVCDEGSSSDLRGFSAKEAVQRGSARGAVLCGDENIERKKRVTNNCIKSGS